MASAEDVKKLAALARLSIPEDKLEARAAEFDRIVAYIAQLDELDIRTDATPQAPHLRNVFREDGEPTAAATWTEKLVGMFPRRDGDHLSVKKIISHD
ncbi:MAG: aspartyl-tRNA(Asn)/glutamyl-tRNA(Gln) amidotransferase subunit [Candidatus Parcubacteria bacterium]|jgi:aspartyl-tRNA(Asn)/glutamyl-tRNA(Gln) amidotransferase subunit C|nr:aspartyl-tRNA(Asn)/glutamyl-tRNA(Gln) amidotransferase subunit [Candidatus Parcubacteria bacterium]